MLHLYEKYLPHDRDASLMMRSGSGPSTASIMARCSRFSCVWNSASPVTHAATSPSFWSSFENIQA